MNLKAIYTSLIGVFAILLVGTASASLSVPPKYRVMINQAAMKTGVSATDLTAFIAIESKFDTHAVNKDSKAAGLGQFIGSTWRYVLKKHGKKHGLSMRTKQSNPYANILMTAEYYKDNRRFLESELNRKVSPHEVYMAHLLGPNGAKKILTSKGTKPVVKVIQTKCSKRGNGNLYCKNGKSRTVNQFKSNMRELVSNHTVTPNTSKTPVFHDTDIKRQKDPAVIAYLNELALRSQSMITASMHYN